jgi:predicted nucleotidyltransferase
LASKTETHLPIYDDHLASEESSKPSSNQLKTERNTNNSDSNAKIPRKDLVKIKARKTDDTEAPFIPSVYGIEPLELLKGSKKGMEATRLVSYMEEFRLQAKRDETVIINANLEELKTKDASPTNLS